MNLWEKKGFYLLFVSLFISFSSRSQEVPTFENSREGLKQLLAYALTASEAQQRALTGSLIPLREEYDSLFVSPYPKKIYRYHRRLRRTTDIVIRPILDDQEEILLWESTTEGLADYQGEAKFFPGAYTEIAHNLMPGRTWYRMKFVQPGRKLGTAFDLFTYVNGHWRIFHRPWAVMRIRR